MRRFTSILPASSSYSIRSATAATSTSTTTKPISSSRYQFPLPSATTYSSSSSCPVTVSPLMSSSFAFASTKAKSNSSSKKKQQKEDSSSQTVIPEKIQRPAQMRAPKIEISSYSSVTSVSSPRNEIDTETASKKASSSSSSSSSQTQQQQQQEQTTEASGAAASPEEVTSFLNQFQYAAPELGLKLSPPDLAVDLLEYQKEGVGWMARREHFFSGGICADFLGMGKTVQMLALCLARQTTTSSSSSSKRAEGGGGGGETENGGEKKKEALTREIEKQQAEIDRIGFAHGEPFRIQTVIQQLLQIPAVMNVSKITQPARDLIALQQDVGRIVAEHQKFLEVQQSDNNSSAETSEKETKKQEEKSVAELKKVMRELDKWLRFAGKYYVSWEKRARHFLAQRDDGSSSNLSKNGAGGGSDLLLETPELRTLIIVPASLLYQWKHEIDTKIDASRGISTMIYHGSTKLTNTAVADLEMQDFVITTYESVVRGAQGAYLKSEAHHQSSSSSSSAAASTSSPLFSTSGRKGRGGGGGGGKGAGDGTDSMGASIFNRAAASPLFRVRWKRIILDEAHYVRNERTTRFKCIRQLLGLKRWAVTATPLHNSIQDLQTLLTFVGQPRLPLFEANETMLLKDPVLQRAIARSLQPAFLRRTPVMTKQGKEQVLLILPSKDDNVIRGELSESEVIAYNDALTRRQQALSAIKDKSFIHVFAMMTLLRQACCHPWMTEGKNVANHQVCVLCQFEVFSPIITRCGHAFCRECLHMAFRSHSMNASIENASTASRSSNSSNSSSSENNVAVRLPCPACEVPIPFSIFSAAPKLNSTDHIAQLKQKKWVSSSKMDMLMNAITEIQTQNPEEKIVIFAQFTTLLDIVSVAVEKNFPDMRYVRIDGSLSLRVRNGLIHSFSTDPKVKILLASKMAMGVGLNLTAANHVIILDPWWNPQVEEQAVHRCHRIGQQKHVRVQRFVMNDTIEQYCYEISRKKKDFGDAVLKAATEDQDNKEYKSPAKQVAEMVAKTLKPISLSSK